MRKLRNINRQTGVIQNNNLAAPQAEYKTASLPPTRTACRSTCVIQNFKLTATQATNENLCWNYHAEQRKKASKRGNVGKQTYLQTSASPYIVPKYAHFSNMRSQCGAVCRSTLQKSCILYITGAYGRYHRDKKNIPSNFRGQMQCSDKASITKNCE